MGIMNGALQRLYADQISNEMQHPGQTSVFLPLLKVVEVVLVSADGSGAGSASGEELSKSTVGICAAGGEPGGEGCRSCSSSSESTTVLPGDIFIVVTSNERPLALGWRVAG